MIFVYLLTSTPPSGIRFYIMCTISAVSIRFVFEVNFCKFFSVHTPKFRAFNRLNLITRAGRIILNNDVRRAFICANGTLTWFGYEHELRNFLNFFRFFKCVALYDGCYVNTSWTGTGGGERSSLKIHGWELCVILCLDGTLFIRTINKRRSKNNIYIPRPAGVRVFFSSLRLTRSRCTKNARTRVQQIHDRNNARDSFAQSVRSSRRYYQGWSVVVNEIRK